MNYPENYYYTKEHEWVYIDNNDIAFVGLTGLALLELQTVESIEVDSLHKTLGKDQVFARIKTVKYLYKLIMPFQGTIIEVNSENINNKNKRISTDSWIVKIKLSHPIDMSGLLSRDEYKLHKTDNIFHMIKYFISLNTGD
jgi:glycine cleavage system H protein